MTTIAPIFELQAACDELEAELFAVVEREDGPGQRAAKEQLLRLLRRSVEGGALTREAALRIIADAGQQIKASGADAIGRANGRANGRKMRPEPDLAYNAGNNKNPQRVNVEVDSDPKAAARHIRELQSADRSGLHVAIVVHPVTGAPMDGMYWDPKDNTAKRIGPTDIRALQRGELPTFIPPPLRSQVNDAVPPRKVRSAKSVNKVLDAAVKNLEKKSTRKPRSKPTPTSRRTAPPRPRPTPSRKSAFPQRRKGSRESELEFAAFEFESKLGIGAEQIDVDVPGIPGHNQWFTNAGQARRAALRAATRAGARYTIAHDARPSRGQPHYHVQGPDGTRVSGHFFYGRRPPRRILRGRPNRESELAFAGRDLEFELAGA